MIRRMDTSLRRMRHTAALPDRLDDESFRTYYRRVAQSWLDSHGSAHPELALQVSRILERDIRRRPRG